MLSPVPVWRGHGDVAAGAAERAAAGHHQHLLWQSQSPVYQEAAAQRPVRPMRRRAEMTGGESWRRLGPGHRSRGGGAAEEVRRLLLKHVNVGTRLTHLMEHAL